ncbi:MAG: hypothetical protein A3D64_00720 [Candidatus Wildermuthbacteria bacterium RIFCSPHIGHO2_02_FULL_49_9]|uniref:POTRA domain-containing protein n=1 Tax=Candidatus Wildermuthbacteria bacterium RIFCSPHIGHO2_02_FULL_49_9 TaxID=1802456 RepID=A0A1G2RBD0_9BACT|nr:MAG: hypothetical protein A3D64_00720 [Candidatus Wildermuthbacteria bacterium RIFCSPHIGHO2_02_FULL_49_9]
MRKLLRFKRKKKRASFLKRRLFWYAAGLLFLLTFLFWAVMFSSWLEIREVKVQGTNEVAKERIAAVVKESFWRDFFGVPQNSILLANLPKLQAELRERFPAFSLVSLRRSLPHALVVEVVERQQVGTWCARAQAGEDSPCFAVDRAGIPFAEAEQDAFFAVFSSWGTAVLGEELLDPSLLSLLLGFQEKFEKAGEPAGFSVSAFEIGSQGQVEARTAEGWKILLDLAESMEWQETKLELVLRQKIPPERREELEYIDVRFGDQAYLKYLD